MAQTNYTPISLYYSTTASTAPIAGNLVSGELAINITDGKLFYKDNAGVVQTLATKATTSGSFASTTISTSETLSYGTINGVAYLNGSRVLTTGGVLVFDGTNLGLGTASPSFSGSSRRALTLNAPTGQLSILELGVNGSLAGYLYSNASQTTLTSVGSTPITFETSSAEQARLTNKALMVGYTSDSGFSGSYNLGVAGSVGIGTSSPSAKLEVIGSGRFGNATTAGQISLNAVTGAGTQVNWNTNGTTLFALGTNVGSGDATNWSLYDYANSLTAFTVQKGNLGLGVTPSASYSNSKNIQFQYATLNSDQQNGHANLTCNAYESGNTIWSYVTSNPATRYQQTIGGVHAWYNAGTGTAGNTISFTQAMTLDASGNLVLGTTSTGYALDVYRATSTASYVVGRNGSGVQTAIGVAGDNGSLLGTLSNHNLRFVTNGAVVGTFDTSGKLLINSPAFTDGTLSVKAKVSTAAISAGVFNNGDNVVNFYNASNTYVASIAVNAGTVVYGTVSDYRLKTVIGAVTDQGARIDALEPIKYTWNSDGSQTRGFLAHKFQEVYPQSVTGEKDAVDAEGNLQYQNMQASTSEVIADLVAEIQSLRKRLAALESK